MIFDILIENDFIQITWKGFSNTIAHFIQECLHTIVDLKDTDKEELNGYYDKAKSKIISEWTNLV